MGRLDDEYSGYLLYFMISIKFISENVVIACNAHTLRKLSEYEALKVTGVELCCATL